MRYLIFALAFTSCHPKTDEPIRLGSAPTYRAYFSPKGGCEINITSLIATSKSKIRVFGYSFTSKLIRDALISRFHPSAGAPVDEGVILDRSDTSGPSVLPDLVAAGIPTWIDSTHAIFHDKVVLSDDLTTETGSFNFTYQAEHSNAENCLFIRNKALTAEYDANWELHKSHSVQVSPAPPP